MAALLISNLGNFLSEYAAPAWSNCSIKLKQSFPVLKEDQLVLFSVGVIRVSVMRKRLLGDFFGLLVFFWVLFFIFWGVLKWPIFVNPSLLCEWGGMVGTCMASDNMRKATNAFFNLRNCQSMPGDVLTVLTVNRVHH